MFPVPYFEKVAPSVEILLRARRDLLDICNNRQEDLESQIRGEHLHGIPYLVTTVRRQAFSCPL